MRKHLLLTAAVAPLFVASIALAASDYTQTVESYNPIAYYQFSASNPTGSSVTSPGGQVYNGTLEGTPPATTTSTGPALADDPGNTALNLTGNGLSGAAGQYFNAFTPANTADEVSTAGTILAWINLDSLPTTAGRIYYIAGESTYGDDFDLQIDSGDNTIRLYTNSGGNVDSAPLTSGDLGQWIFVAATFTNGGNATVYINGAVSGTGGAGYHTASASQFSIGASDVFGNRYLDGSIDEVAFYNTDLSDTDIANIYASANVPAGSVVPLPASVWGGIGLLGALAAGGLSRKRAAFGK